MMSTRAIRISTLSACVLVGALVLAVFPQRAWGEEQSGSGLVYAGIITASGGLAAGGVAAGLIVHANANDDGTTGAAGIATSVVGGVALLTGVTLIVIGLIGLSGSSRPTAARHVTVRVGVDGASACLAF
jgi:hypothetical protein